MENINLKEFVFDVYAKDNNIFKRDKVSFMFPTWSKDEVIKQANELGYKYELNEASFDLFGGNAKCIHMTIEVDSMIPELIDLY
tara:strand:+ start:402 stop:653 length:252 start_codon:yes stop_codon:yes gene_type:complete